jgi:hypothetical protein
MRRWTTACALIVLTMGSVPASAEVTFNKDVLPILQRKCQVCHRPGEIGPMPLLTYQGTRPWARAIRAAVVGKAMPPWFADPQYGSFANEKRLTAEEIATITSWVDAGAPEGDAKDKPAPVTFRDGWNIRPDLVFQFPKPLKIPAQGTVEYTYVAVSPPFKEDTWIAAGEIRPTDRARVHHVIAMVRPKGSKWMVQAQLGAEPWAPGPTRHVDMARAVGGDMSVLTSEFFVGYVPGMEAQRFDVDRSARLIPAGADVVIEIHYTTNGVESEDQTKVGFELAPGPPERAFISVAAAQPNLQIAPGDANAEATAILKFGQPVDLVYFQPHMHLRGKDATIEAKYPDGKRETLLRVPRYDFNWQIVYYQKNALRLPKGTELHLTGHWDNSPANKWNPDPEAAVRWGDQSWQEMLSAPMGVIVDRTVDPKTVIEGGGFPGAAPAQQ